MSFPASIQSALLTGYSIFTTFTVQEGKVKGFLHHLDRLEHSAKSLFGITPQRKEIIEKIIEFVEKEYSLQKEMKCKKDILVRVALFPEDFSIAFPGRIDTVHIVVSGRALSVPEKALRLQLHENIRPLAHLKTSSLFQSLQIRKKAQKNGFDDSLFFYEGNITEGPAWNIGFGTGSTLFFPDPSQKTFLEGFTQKLLQENLPSSYSIVIKDIPKNEIGSFEYAFILSSGVGIIPVQSIENTSFNTSKVLGLQNIYNSIAGENIKDY